MYLIRKSLLAVILCGAAIFSYSQTPSQNSSAPMPDPVVGVTGGNIRGHVTTRGRAEFLGIPYAQPPVGDLRWHEPIPPKPWQGVLETTSFGAPCAQNVYGDWNRRDAERGKEECLFLNVITPEWPVKNPLPVMVWIHGGANTGGTASSPLYKDGTLVDHGIILVTVNYRLGVFGFFAHPELTKESPHHASGNYALMDQIAALHWVHDNIAKFGGDVHNITLFGQSAGALDTGLLMTSPLSKDLFQRAIAESGTVLLTGDAPSLPVAEEAGTKFTEGIKAPAADPLKFLRSLSASQLLDASRPGGSPGYNTTPVIDGWVLPQSPAKVFANGDESHIPFLLGNNTREFDFPATPDQLRRTMGEVYGDLAPEALKVYGLTGSETGSTDPLYGSVANQWSADAIFRCPATAISALHNEAHQVVYEYQFERAIPGQEALGSVHSAELPYVFGYYPRAGNISGAFGQTDFKITQLVEAYFTNFAKSGNPNGNGLPSWPEFDSKQAYVSITEDGQVVAGTQLRQSQCEIYRENMKRRLAH